MNSEKKEFLEQMSAEITGFMNQLKEKYDLVDIEYLGSYYFKTGRGMDSGTVVGQFSDQERLISIANSFMLHDQLRAELMRITLKILYHSVNADETLNLPSTEELGDMLKGISDN